MRLRHFFTMVCMLAVIGIATPVYGVSDNFRVRTFVGEDTTPPTTPDPLTATPIATTQIDLSWGTSTDDFELTGYQVFRDGVQIATTTATTYSDTGLTASTTYSYYITAYDSFNNVSASSTEVATTTPAVPPPSPTPSTESDSATQGSLTMSLHSLTVIPEENAVIIRFETGAHVRAVIRWGKTSSYELGVLGEGSFSKTHETKITGLMPGTRYRFSIEGESVNGNVAVLTEREFTTLAPEDTFAPANVAGLRAQIDGDDVVLWWQNPGDADLEKVRVLHSDRFYPSDIADGEVVYEGLGEEVRDLGRAIPNTTQYYTVFSYDALGNISSGAVVAVRISDAGGTSTVPIGDETINPISLMFEHFTFIQDGEALQVVSGDVRIDGAKSLTIALPYDVVPEHLKTILVTLTDSADASRVFTFLLRVNADKTAYVATIAPLGISGVFPVAVSVFDFKTAQVGYAKGTITSQILFVRTGGGQDESSMLLLFTSISRLLGNLTFWFVLLLIFLLLMARRLIRHS